MPNHPQPPVPPARPAQPTQPAKPQAPPSSDLQPPQKYERPLPQPGDKDYVVGQPIDDEEADKVEKEQNERYAAAQKAAQEAKDKSHEKD
jgi:hypothetical protein